MRGPLLRATAHGLTGLAALVVLAWVTGHLLSDRAAWSQWLLWLPTPAALGAALGALALALRPARTRALRRRRIAAWAAAAAFLATTFALVEHRLLRPAPAREGFMVVHWNVSEHLIDVGTPFDERLRGWDADLTILTDANWTPWRAEMRDWLGEEHHPRQRRPFAILTRHPIVALRTLARADDISLVLLEIETPVIPDRPLVMLLVDLPSEPRLPRHAIAARARRYLAEAEAPEPDVVIGDFNMTRGSASARSIFPGMRHAFRDGGHGYVATFPRAVPLYHIDHVLLAGTVRAARYDVIDAGFGRHRAQMVWLKGRDVTR